jgi:ParB/RepB/Spo0J family partition protein
VNDMEIQEIQVGKLKVDKFNVRHGEWNEDEELTESIKHQGVLEPLLVRRIDDKNNPFSIVCGTRRWHAAIDAGLKNVPCVVRQLTDVQALGTSLQENLQRNSLDRVQEAEAVAKMWEMLDGERSYEQRMSELKKQFGLSETSVTRHLQISRLSTTFKERYLKPSRGKAEKLDTHTAAGISAKTDWNEADKEDAAEILGRIESAEKRRGVLSKMKSYSDLSPKESYEKIRHVREDRQYNYFLPASLTEAFDDACSKSHMSWSEIITEAVREWLEKKGFL